METKIPSSRTFYQAQAQTPPPPLEIKFNCYTCLEPLHVLTYDGSLLPGFCGGCGHPVRLSLALVGRANWNAAQQLRYLVDEAAFEAAIEDRLTKSYKGFGADDYEDCQKDLWDLEAAASHLERAYKEWSKDPVQEVDAEAELLRWLGDEPRYKGMRRRVEQGRARREQSAEMERSGPGMMQVLKFQVSRLGGGGSWGAWRSVQESNRVAALLKQRLATCEAILKAAWPTGGA